MEAATEQIELTYVDLVTGVEHGPFSIEEMNEIGFGKGWTWKLGDIEIVDIAAILG